MDAGSLMIKLPCRGETVNLLCWIRFDIHINTLYHTQYQNIMEWEFFIQSR
jgi:hypothetical protein